MKSGGLPAPTFHSHRPPLHPTLLHLHQHLHLLLSQKLIYQLLPQSLGSYNTCRSCNPVTTQFNPQIKKSLTLEANSGWKREQTRQKEKGLEQGVQIPQMQLLLSQGYSYCKCTLIRDRNKRVPTVGQKVMQFEEDWQIVS